MELAKRLGKTQQFVSKVENLDRRIDVIEFCAFARAMGEDPVGLFAEVVRKLPDELQV